MYHRKNSDCYSQLGGCKVSLTIQHFLLCTIAKTTRNTQDIGGPHAGDDNDDIYVLNLDDFTGLTRNFATKIVSHVIAPCATNVRIEAVIAGFAGAPRNILCNERGETCGEADDGEISLIQDCTPVSEPDCL